jgi:membrane associated rhomboid family serine protease
MLQDVIASLTFMVSQTKANGSVLGVMVGVLWGIFFITRLDTRLLLLGIIPRHLRGIPGILFAPVLHANLNHLFFNTFPLVVLGNFLLMGGVFYFVVITIVITVVSGSLIWCFAKPGLHIGASAVVTGYWGVLVSNSYHHVSVTSLILAVICLYYFAGIFYGVFPGKKGVSWEGHLFGLFAGLGTSYCLT